jgi:hypothetical protein
MKNFLFGMLSGSFLIILLYQGGDEYRAIIQPFRQMMGETTTSSQLALGAVLVVLITGFFLVLNLWSFKKNLEKEKNQNVLK